MMVAQTEASKLSSLLSYRDVAASSRLLVVGAGGIGCELLKNLVTAGFLDIVVIDLDTIDVTNLNRQFLFHRQHVGKPKAIVARESALAFNPDAKINAIHDSITNPEYGVNWFKQFRLVLNALDNRAARSHVNRLCLAAQIPLVESGTAGYLGQVTVIQRGATECYECTPKPHQKTFPGCTIRNTPSELIHCVVWAKHLFNQLFGATDPDEEVSPDTADPEAAEEKAGDAANGAAGGGEGSSSAENTKNGNVVRVSTRQWAVDCDYDAKKLFVKLFNEDIKYLLTMDKLWQKRTPPVPLEWEELARVETPKPETGEDIKDQNLWSLPECVKVFESSVDQLKNQLKALSDGDNLVWDKDDEPGMNFVAACGNIRAHIFHIEQKSLFEIKSMAGNIIPAIATTNAVIAGAIVMEAIKLLVGRNDYSRTVYFSKKPNHRGKVLVPCLLDKPNPRCYVCAEKPEVTIKMDIEKTTVKTLEQRILKSSLHMVAPDVEVDGRGTILISSDPEDLGDIGEKCLGEFGLKDGSVLVCDDYQQNYNLRIILSHSDSLEDGVDFEIVGEVERPPENAENGSHKSEENGAQKVPEVMDESSSSRKRTASDSIEVIEDVPRKRVMMEAPVLGSGDVDCVTLDDDSADGNNAAGGNLAAVNEDDDDCVCID